MPTPIPFIHPERGPLHLGRPRVSKPTRRAMAKALAVGDFMATLPPAPAVFDLTGGILDWGMMGNDLLGDCTEAAKGHLLQAWTKASGSEVTLPDSVIVQAYEDECGYNPANPATDQGGEIVDVLNHWQTAGLGGHKIYAHA